MNDEKKELRKTEEILYGKFMAIDGKKTLLDLAIYVQLFYFKYRQSTTLQMLKCMYKDYRFRPLSIGHHQVTCIQV
jgi:hypothetical protein